MAIRLPMSWGQFKTLVEAQGITDADHLYYIDVGPTCNRLFISREKLFETVVGRGRSKQIISVVAIEISDDPVMLNGNEESANGKKEVEG